MYHLTRQLLAWCLGVAVSCHAAPTLAEEVHVVPSHDGYIGAWLVAGPVPESGAHLVDPRQIDPTERGNLAPGAWWPGFRTLATPDGPLDLMSALHVGLRGGARAALGGEIELVEPLDGWLLVSADGGTQVVVDGRTLMDRDTERQRGSSWDAVPLRLDAGRHRIVLWLHHRGTRWSCSIRLLDAALEPPRGMSVVLPGTDERDARRLERVMLSLSVAPGLEREAFRPRVHIAFDRGAPRTQARRVSVTLTHKSGPPRTRTFDAGLAPNGARGVAPSYDVTLPPLSSADLKDTARLFVDVRVGAAERRASLTLSPLALASVGRAHALIDAIVDGHHPELSDPDTIVATLERLIRRVTTRGTSNRWENGLIEMRARELSDWVARVSAGRDPLHTETGVIEFAVRSNLDGSPQALRLHVPAAYGAGSTKRFPLVIALHGYNGSARGIMNAFLDTQRTEPRADVEGFVAAPYAHGNAFYRGPGESNVMQVLDWLTRTYPIDVNRISITGVSMGGTGAAHIALRHASTFSAAAPLCGYQSYFVRRDTSDRPLREWELGRMHHWSPASWAENGRNLPLYVAHGTRDLPLANSRVLVDRYNALDY